MAKLKPWYHVVDPREDLKENRALDASEFAVHLEHIRQGRAHEDYAKPARFFDRTFMTKALLDLCAQTVRRLSGIKLETSAVFNMATQFGGGKTHALTALYHLAGGGEAAKAWKGVDAILRKAGVSTVPRADAAVFVGTEFDAVTGRGGEGEPLRKTPWGEIAFQLDRFEAVAEHDKKGVAPGGDVIRRMLPDEPVVILMDELLNFISRSRKLNLGGELFNFIQNLSEEARARDNMVLCVSIPSSELEISPEDQRDHEALKKLLDRLGKAIMMSAETETAEIIRRRLFDWSGLSDDGRKAALQYADWAVEHAAELSGVDAASARDLFTASYPFHPAVLSVFERKWQSLPRFQRTRGILRLLALWVQYAHQADHRRSGGKGDALITLGSAPIEDPIFRAAMFEQLGSNELEGPVTTDIAGKSDAWAVRLDREASEAIKKERLHQKVATSILFESNGGQTKKLYALVSEIRAAVGSPDVIMTDVEHILEQLTSSCYYLSQDGNQYKFSLTPNLNKVLTDRRAAIAPAAIEQRVKKEIGNQFKAPKGMEIEWRPWPEKSADVPDRPELTLVTLGPDMPAGQPATLAHMQQIVRECGSSGRTMKSALIFVAPESPGAIAAAARDVLAWEDIEDDTETTKRLDNDQKRALNLGIGRAKSDLREAVWRSYRHLYLLDKNNELMPIDLGQTTSSMAPSLVELIIQQLIKRDEVIDSAPGPNRLLKYWPPALDKWSTKAVRNAFYSSPALPRLLKAAAVKRTISDGVAQGLIGYARDNGSGGLTLERFTPDSLPEGEVEIEDDVFILRAGDSRKLLEPPRLARLTVSPSYVTLKPGEKASFSAAGIDQYGQPFPAVEVTWTGTGGTIDRAGTYEAGKDAGVFAAKAIGAGAEGVAQVRIAATDSIPAPGGTTDPGTSSAGEAVLRWSGSIPPQKWMNFYTKIVSKYASNPDLRLSVTFEVPIDAADRESRERDVRSALTELGIQDDST